MHTDTDPTPAQGTPRATFAEYCRNIADAREHFIFRRNVADARECLATVTTLAGALTYTLNTPTGTPAEVATRLRKLSLMLAEAAADTHTHAKNIAAAIAE